MTSGASLIALSQRAILKLAGEGAKDGSYQMFAETPSGRRIWVIWRYDREDDEIPDVFGDLGEVPIFVITAY